MEYRDLFVVEWRNSEPRPEFSEHVYFFEYDGRNCAYSALGGVEAFLFWVVGVIHETTTQQQLNDEADDDFLDRVGVSYGFWSAAQ